MQAPAASRQSTVQSLPKSALLLPEETWVAAGGNVVHLHGGRVKAPSVSGPWPPGAGSPPSSPTLPGNGGFVYMPGSMMLNADDLEAARLEREAQLQRRREYLAAQVRLKELRDANEAIIAEKWDPGWAEAAAARMEQSKLESDLRATQNWLEVLEKRLPQRSESREGDEQWQGEATKLRESAAHAVQVAAAKLRAFKQSLLGPTRLLQPGPVHGSYGATHTYATLRRESLLEVFGLGLGFKGDALVVTRIHEDSPADRSGLLAVTDHIIAINGVPIDRSTVSGDAELSAMIPSDEATAVMVYDFDARRSRPWAGSAARTRTEHVPRDVVLTLVRDGDPPSLGGVQELVGGEALGEE